MKAGLVSGSVFLVVFAILSLVLLNLATPWIGNADSLDAAGSRLLWLVIPVLLIDAAAGGLAAFLGGRSARRRGVSGRAATFVALAPPIGVALALAVVGATDAAQTVYDLFAVTAGCWAGAHLAGRFDPPERFA